MFSEPLQKLLQIIPNHYLSSGQTQIHRGPCPTVRLKRKNKGGVGLRRKKVDSASIFNMVQQ